MKFSLLLRLSFLIGMLWSLGACYTQGPPTPIVSPTVATPVRNNTEMAASISTMTLSQQELTPVPVKPSASAAETLEQALETPMPPSEALTITILYDNNPYDEKLKSAWGFSALVEYRDAVLLFDTGGDGPTLMANMRTSGIEPTRIEHVLLSHAHTDHTGGLSALLEAGARPTVYLLPSFPAAFKRQVEQFTTVVEVSPGQSIAAGLFTTGEMGRDIPEQALVIRTESGLVIVTGCAHPGIVEIVAQARELFAEPVRLVLGGFHLGSKSEAEIASILKEFRSLGVAQVAPCHCTGARAIAMFAAEYGEDFIQAGVGSVIRLDAITPK
jgi:7,8-dihydropterin-6-yl-methyl-4-(beta-D-ribofuranosyl)aminobenzene 5'-phosphate synthase